MNSIVFGVSKNVGYLANIAAYNTSTTFVREFAKKNEGGNKKAPSSAKKTTKKVEENPQESAPKASSSPAKANSGKYFNKDRTKAIAEKFIQERQSLLKQVPDFLFPNSVWDRIPGGDYLYQWVDSQVIRVKSQEVEKLFLVAEKKEQLEHIQKAFEAEQDEFKKTDLADDIKFRSGELEIMQQL